MFVLGAILDPEIRPRFVACLGRFATEVEACNAARGHALGGTAVAEIVNGTYQVRRIWHARLGKWYKPPDKETDR